MKELPYPILVQRIMKMYDTDEDVEDENYYFKKVHKALDLSSVASCELFNDWEEITEELILVTLHSGVEFIITGEFKEFYKIWKNHIKSKNLFIFANN